MQLGEQKYIEIGGYKFIGTEITNMKILHAMNSTAARWGTFRLGNDTAGYQVPVGKKLIIKVVQMDGGASETLAGCVFGYGDTDVGFDAAAAPTTPIYAYNDTGAGPYSNMHIHGRTPVKQYVHNFEVPAQKYPFYKGGTASSTCRIYCTLEDV